MTKAQLLVMSWGVPMSVGEIREHMFVRAIRANEEQIQMEFGSWLHGLEDFAGIARRCSYGELMELYAQFLDVEFGGVKEFSAYLMLSISEYRQERSRDEFRVIGTKSSAEGICIFYEYEGYSSTIAFSAPSRQFTLNSRVVEPRSPFHAGDMIDIASHLHYAVGQEIGHDADLALMHKLLTDAVFGPRSECAEDGTDVE